MRYHEDEQLVRRGGGLGAYWMCQATIRLGSYIDLFDDQGVAHPEQNPHHAAVFLHEYMHYLHNCSTLVGVEQLVATCAMVGAYAQTLAPDHNGHSLGAAALEGARREFFEAARTGFKHFARPWNAPHLFDGTQSLSVVSWRPEIVRNEPAGVLKNALVSADFSLGNTAVRREFVLDTQIIEEGLALAIEELFLTSFGESTSGVPYFPYYVLRDVVRTYAPKCSALDYLRLGTIALNTTNPGVWLMSFLSTSSAAGLLSESEHLPVIVGWADVFSKVRQHLEAKLAAAELSFKGRGLLEPGIGSIAKIARALLSRRLSDPFFDLPSSTAAVDGRDMFAIMTNVLPCEVLLERAGDGNLMSRDLLLTFGDAETNADVEGRRAYQLAVEATLAHLDPSTFEFVPSGQRRKRCPLYTMCPHPIRQTKAHLCAGQPWTTVAEPRENHCWYASGVLGLMATVDVKKVK